LDEIECHIHCDGFESGLAVLDGARQARGGWDGVGRRVARNEPLLIIR